MINRDGQYFVDVEVTTKKIDTSFAMPIVMGITKSDGSRIFLREEISGERTEFSLGPYENKPNEFVFNEFYSVLSKDKVKEK